MRNKFPPSNNSLNVTAVTFLSVILFLSAIGRAYAVTPAPDGGYPGDNTAEGDNALFSLSDGSGYRNTAIGSASLNSNTSGSDNTAAGYHALFTNSSGVYNVATGSEALFSNTAGNFNLAAGFRALSSNTIGSDNVAYGTYALYSNTAGNENTADGTQALFQNTTGSYNTAIGLQALFPNTTGNNNTAVGAFTSYNNPAGENNIALGYSAGRNVTSGSNNIEIGNWGVADDAHIIRIGDPAVHFSTFISGITGVTLGGGAPVVVRANGQLGTADISTLKGSTGPQGPAGAGFVAGAYLMLPAGAAAPSGFTKVGTTTTSYKDLAGKNQIKAVDLYQKN